jgi:hypothetical protein
MLEVVPTESGSLVGLVDASQAARVRQSKLFKNNI